MKSKICKKCGSAFVPRTNRQVYCGKAIKSTCIICGKPITYACGTSHIPRTCGSKECLKQATKLRYRKNETQVCPICGESFHPVNNTQKFCKKKYHTLTCKICGKQFRQLTDYIKANNGIPRSTCSSECLSKLHELRNSERDTDTWVQKSKNTCMKRYGVESATQLQNVKRKMQQTYMLNTGYMHPSHNPTSRSRQAIARKYSKLEQRISTMLSSYNIDFETQYVVSNGIISHAFDFYIPKYKILLDADGVYFHSYLSDPNGKQVRDDYDSVRIALIPKDHVFMLAVEGNEDRTVKELHDVVKRMDENAFDYDTDVFKWCRKVGFPYPSYSEKRMKSDWNHLCLYENNEYKQTCRLGMSLVKNFHKSIYDCTVGNNVSAKQAWDDDKLLRKVIENRLIYKNNVDPSKVLSGFNISKICPIVSIFNPVLARYLCMEYLPEFSEVFDPFSGFSGRLLGVTSTCRNYIGQDLNKKAVQESNNIISFLGLTGSSVVCKDVFESEGQYQCLLTCPPYGSKETYADESVFKSCDDWIDECLERFKCNRYVFVVDETQKYKDNVVMTLDNSSHLGISREYVIVI